MPIFQYLAKKEDNSTISGMFEAKTEKAVAEFLMKQNMLPLSIVQESKGLQMSINLPWSDRIKVKDLVVFSRQLAVMSEATIPLVQSLRILVDQTDNPKFKKIITALAAEVDGGAKFSQALSKYPKIFSNFFISMVRSGETSGRLDEILNYLADQQERDYDLMSKIKGAMTYPIFIVVGLVGVGIIMMVFVIPRLTSILVESGAELPLPTRILMAVSGFMESFWWLLIIIVVLLVIVSRIIIGTPQGKRYWDLFKIKLPVFGQLFQKVYLVRMTRSLSTLIEGGVPLPQALDITAAVVTNKIYADLIIETKQNIEDGNPLASVFLHSKNIPVMVSQMMSLGEQTGRLDQVLQKLTAFYSREIENLVGSLVSLIEPIIMVVMGVAVGIMVAAIILPMYNLATSF